MELKLLDSSQISRLPPSCIRVVKSPSPRFCHLQREAFER